MAAYYNELDPYAAQWLRNLIARGLIAPGDVDGRSIVEVRPADLIGYDQCHFFAGIGGWSHALRLAGWPDDRPAWTGSCPCQPFSAAGKRKGTADERHLWPEFYRLIAALKPAVVFGEQVASKAGREYLAGVRTDLEAVGYEVGAADLCAAGVGAPHIRQRLWWVADSIGERRTGFGVLLRPEESGRDARSVPETTGRGSTGGLGDADNEGLEGRGVPGRERAGERIIGAAGGNAWVSAIWFPCADGKARRIEPGIEPLAHGVPGRVGRLRAYGNAIVPQVAAEFIRAVMTRRP